MDFVRLGSHIIAPERNEFATPYLSVRFDVLNTARMLESQLKEVEALCEENKTRRADNRKRAAALDKVLMSLRIQEQKERDTTLKLSRSWAKINGITVSNRGAISIVQAHATTTLPSLSEVVTAPVLEPRICFADQAASSFRDCHERYRDSYTFSGPAWQTTLTRCLPLGNDATSSDTLLSACDHTGDPIYTWFDSPRDNNNSFASSAPHWRTSASPGEQHDCFTGVGHDDQTVNQQDSLGNPPSMSNELVSVLMPPLNLLNDTQTPWPASVGSPQILGDLRAVDVGNDNSGRKRSHSGELDSVKEYSYAKRQGWKRTKISLPMDDHESESAMLIGNRNVVRPSHSGTGRQHSRFGNRPWRNRLGRKP